MNGIPGWKPLIVCGDSLANMCQFSDFIVLANNLIQDLVILATILTVAVFIWAGLKLVSASLTGNSGALNDAKKMFFNVVKGYAIIVAAWVIVYTILHALVDPKYWLLG